MWLSLRIILLVVALLAPASPNLAQTVAPAPREPVHKAAPVVTPHGAHHPHKPAPPAGSAKPAPAASAKPAPTEPFGPPSSAAVAPAVAAKPADPDKPEGTPSKLPRFASLRSDEVNMRAGPGLRYRIDWVYRRREMPVEIQREYDVWRYVRDVDGIQGWMQQATLVGRRSFIVQKEEATLRAEARDNAPAVAILKPGVIGRIRSCQAGSDWCNVQSGSYRGYLRRVQFWGTLAGEVISP